VGDKAFGLAQQGRDLQAWAWLARSLLATDGLAGLATGLELIARGLQRYWDTLEPIDLESEDPQERFLGRLTALSVLGMTSFQVNREHLNGRTVFDLGTDLDKAINRIERDGAARELINRSRAAIESICRAFRDGFGANSDSDPQVAFELISEKLAVAEADLLPVAGDAGEANVKPAPASTGRGEDTRIVVGRDTSSVSSPDDVVRVLDTVLEYYRTHEPSSPVPLLIGRARGLVSKSFLEAMKDLAPGSIKELELIAGPLDRK
jgi:type VI secretion system protein ImpA